MGSLIVWLLIVLVIGLALMNARHGVTPGRIWDLFTKCRHQFILGEIMHVGNAAKCVHCGKTRTKRKELK